jgi:hypothetical protein
MGNDPRGRRAELGSRSVPTRLRSCLTTPPALYKLNPGAKVGSVRDDECAAAGTSAGYCCYQAACGSREVERCSDA